MKKKMLPLAVSAAAAVSMSASAQMYIENSGMGEILIFPFYSAEGGNATNISIVNTTDHGKAVKVRFIEGENSYEVLDFNVYMSPKDHFSMAVSATADGGGQVVTYDNTCTVPSFEPGVPEPFRGTLFKDEKKATAPGAFDNSSITRSAVGYIEVIEMGQLVDTKTGLVPDWNKAAAAETTNLMLTAITHDATGVPADCTLPNTAWSTAAGGTKGTWKAEFDAAGKGKSYFSKTWIGGGLYGYAGVVNAADATAFGEDAIAIASAVDKQKVNGAGGEGGWALHYQPGNTNPDFSDSNLATTSSVAYNGAIKDFTFALAPVQTVSSLIQTDEIVNDYVTDSTIAALTDWVITMPTKSFYVNVAGARADAPFFDKWDKKTACEYAALTLTDREESNPAPPPGSKPDFSPAPETDTPDIDDLPLCYETNIVQFGAESAVKNESLAVGVNARLDAADGWASISFDPADLQADSAKLADATRLIQEPAGAQKSLRGLPVVGFAVQTYTNNNVNGSGNVANYAMSNEHKMVVVGS